MSGGLLESEGDAGRESGFSDQVGADCESGFSDQHIRSPEAMAATAAAAPTQTDAAAQARQKEARTSLIGATLAHFRIDRLLGKGGMGEVYLANDMALERPVAVKILPREIAEDRRLQERFYREARFQARIPHANICHIYFVGEQDGNHFFAMEYIDGESLQERLNRLGALPFEEAIECCRMAALGLREAHSHGFTHRDIKPSNLMVDKNGVVKVVDFGLVKESSEGSVAAPVGGSDAAKTAVVGTPLYMAPEQGSGRAVDFRSDIYALGATLHQLVSGRPPFVGDSMEDLLSQHASSPRPSLDSGQGGRASLDTLCDRMMAKEPEKRFSSYDELISALDQISPARTRPAGPWVRSFALLIDLVCVSVLSVPFLVFGYIDGAIWLWVLGLLYSSVGHARWGKTLGKALFELEVIPFMESGPLSYSRAALRFLVQWAPFYAPAVVGALFSRLGLDGFASEFILVALVILAMGVVLYDVFVSVRRSPNKMALWDRIARTQVCYGRATAMGWNRWPSFTHSARPGGRQFDPPDVPASNAKRSSYQAEQPSGR
ncbi:MAG: protein kinase [Proteobacteria bacterium]|nr:protein kinase [Pseudomonadota bacterium]